MSKENPFYNKFINEENIKNIENPKIQARYWAYSFSIALFSLCGPTFPTFVGYNFENSFAISMFCWDMFMYFWLVYFSIKFIKLDDSYHVFKRKKDLIIFILIYFVLSISFSIAAIFTATFTSYPDTSFIVDLNPCYYFFIFLPLYFSYIIFCFYAFMKCFGKYVQRNKL